MGSHAAHLDVDTPQVAPSASPATAHTLFAWRHAVSPHLAVAHEGRAVSDEELHTAVVAQLSAAAKSFSSAGAGMVLVETAGGVCSPAPSGALQVISLFPHMLTESWHGFDMHTQELCR